MGRKNKFGLEDSWIGISMQTGHEATKRRAKEFDLLRQSHPQLIEVDETGKTPTVKGNMTYDDKVYETDPWRMYQYKPKEDEPQGDPAKRAKGRQVYIKEKLPTGDVLYTEREAYTKADGRAVDGKKTKNGDSYFDKLYQVTRSGAVDQREYDSSLYRTELGVQEFENKKYTIEQKAALAQVPASMLGAAMFHYYGSSAYRGEKFDLSDKEIDELFRGSSLGKRGMNADALREYTKSPEGAAEIGAYILLVEAKKRGYDIYNLSKTQQEEVLGAFNRRMNIPDQLGKVTKEFVPIFEEIYASLPGQEREATWLEDSDNYFDYEDVFLL